MSKITTVAINILPLLFFSTVSTFIPRENVWIVFLLYTIALISIISLIPRIRARKISTESKGSIVFRCDEKIVMNIVMRDQELFNELRKQMRGTFLLMIIPFVLWFIIIPPLSNILIIDNASYLEKFLRYLVFYGIMWGLIYAMRYVLMPKKIVIPVTKYEVFTTGIRYSNAWISFPIDKNRYEINIDYKRSFIEIYDRNTKQVHRLYTNDVYKLQSLIEKYGQKV